MDEIYKMIAEGVTADDIIKKVKEAEDRYKREKKKDKDKKIESAREKLIDDLIIYIATINEEPVSHEFRDTVQEELMRMEKIIAGGYPNFNIKIDKDKSDDVIDKYLKRMGF